MPESRDHSSDFDPVRDGTVFESEDHSEIEIAISQAREKERAITRTHNSIASRRYAIGVAIVILAFGGLLVLAGIGWRIATDVENVTEVNASDIVKGLQLKKRIGKVLVGDSSELVKGFVIFVRDSTGIPSAPDLTTGIEYDDNVSLEPVKQWCYLTTPNLGGTTDTRFTLRIWDQFKGHMITPITSQIGDKFNTSISKLEQLNERCNFVGEGKLHVSSIRNLIERNRTGDSELQKPGEFTKTIGTGFFISKQGDVLTNSHVVDRCKTLRVHQDGKSVPATITSNNRNDDLAILKTTAKTKRMASFGTGKDVRPGDEIVAVGYPLQGILSRELKITKGLVNSLAGLGDDPRMMQVSAEIQPGNSGGPLFDKFGNVVGVVTSKLNSLKLAEHTGDIAQNVNFAIKGSVVRKFLDSESVGYSSSESNKNVTTADIFEYAREFTVLVECQI